MKATLPPDIAQAVTMTLHSLASSQMWAKHVVKRLDEEGISKAAKHDLRAIFSAAMTASAYHAQRIKVPFGGVGGEELARLAKAPEGLAVILKAYMDGTDEMREAMEAFAEKPEEYVTA